MIEKAKRHKEMKSYMHRQTQDEQNDGVQGQTTRTDNGNANEK